MTLEAPDQATVTAARPEQLIYQQLGWNIPVSQLVYWIKGIPSPNQPHQPEVDGFQQHGWRVSYPRQTLVEQYALPAKMIARHPQVTVTLIQKSWQLHSDCSPPQ